MEKIEWKVGDFCYHEFQLKQIKRIENGRVKELSDGYFSSSYGGGFNEEIFPISLEAKRMSEMFDSYKKKLKDAEGTMNINWADICRELNRKWVEIMSCNNDGVLIDLVHDFQKYIHEFVEKLEELQNLEYEGVRIFR